jgi:hypothetical protein
VPPTPAAPTNEVCLGPFRAGPIRLNRSKQWPSPLNCSKSWLNCSNTAAAALPALPPGRAAPCVCKTMQKMRCGQRYSPPPGATTTQLGWQQVDQSGDARGWHLSTRLRLY